MGPIGLIESNQFLILNKNLVGPSHAICGRICTHSITLLRNNLYHLTHTNSRIYKPIAPNDHSFPERSTGKEFSFLDQIQSGMYICKHEKSAYYRVSTHKEAVIIHNLLTSTAITSLTNRSKSSLYGKSSSVNI